MSAFFYKGKFPLIVTNNGEESYNVIRFCANCDYFARHEHHVPWIFNAKTGTMHLLKSDGESTLCGRIATEVQWLWQL